MSSKQRQRVFLDRWGSKHDRMSRAYHEKLAEIAELQEMDRSLRSMQDEVAHGGYRPGPGTVDYWRLKVARYPEGVLKERARYIFTWVRLVAVSRDIVKQDAGVPGGAFWVVK